MSKDTARQEVEQVCFAYEKAGKTGNKKDWGKFYDLEELDYWVFPNIPDGKESYRSALCEAYLAGKALAVELVEVTDE